MELKTIIYIIAAVIYLYSRSKKRDKNSTGQTQPEDPDDVDVTDWEETLRRMTGGGERKTIKNPDPTDVKPQAPVSYETLNVPVRDYDEEVLQHKQVKNAYEAAVQHRKLPRNLDEEAVERLKAESLEEKKNIGLHHHVKLVTVGQSDEYSGEEWDIDAGQLRKGIIYAEILKPKYF